MVREESGKPQYLQIYEQLIVLPFEFAYEYLERLCSEELLSIIAFLVNLAFGLPRQLVVCLPNESRLI